MKNKILLEIDGALNITQSTEELNDYKRAIYDIKESLHSIISDNSGVIETCIELQYFINTELPEILEGLDID